MANIDKKKSKENLNGFSFAFAPKNYILMGIGIVVLFIGYILLCGGGSKDPNVFNTAMFDQRRLVVAPIMITLGLVLEIVAIMLKSKDKNAKTEEKSDNE